MAFALPPRCSNYLSAVNIAGNLAYYQPATQSATYNQGGVDLGAALAVDDQISTFSYTGYSTTPTWWQLDLGGLATVDSVALLQPDACVLCYYFNYFSKTKPTFRQGHKLRCRVFCVF